MGLGGRQGLGSRGNKKAPPGRGFRSGEAFIAHSLMDFARHERTYKSILNLPVAIVKLVYDTWFQRTGESTAIEFGVEWTSVRPSCRRPSEDLTGGLKSTR